MMKTLTILSSNFKKYDVNGHWWVPDSIKKKKIFFLASNYSYCPSSMFLYTSFPPSSSLWPLENCSLKFFEISGSGFHISDIMLFSYPWLISLSAMISSFMHVIINNRILSFLWPNNGPVCVVHFSNPLSVDRYFLCLFHGYWERIELQ